MARRRIIDVERDKALEAIYREMGMRARSMEFLAMGQGEVDARIIEALGHAAWALEQAAHLSQQPGAVPSPADTATQWGRRYHPPRP